MSHIKDFEHLKIKLEAIKSATNNFAAENVIGNGGFGKVYKGEIVHFKGKSTVAFKRLDRAFGQGNPEFWKEIMMLSLYKHENIVSLLGFCEESDEKILVYEYMSKRSLDLYLTNDNLTWIQRLEICIGAARGLAYLHRSFGTHTRVLHRDIKSSNILLDPNWSAKISDFGLSKFGLADQPYTFLFSNPVGTIGYCDPLYVETGFLTKESDVYSFGVVLFEVLCGRLCIGNKSDKRRPLTEIAREFYKHNKMSELVFCNIKDVVHPKSLQAYSTIAYRCLKKTREERPLMNEVVRILESALEYQVNGESLKQSDVVEVHKLKEESSFIFNFKYFEDTILAGKWEEIETYLNQFTNLEDNRYSQKIFFEIRKQKYLEALDRKDLANAVEILMKELKIFSYYDAQAFKEATLLIPLDNIRESDQLSHYGDIKSQRHIMLGELIELVKYVPSILCPVSDEEEIKKSDDTNVTLGETDTKWGQVFHRRKKKQMEGLSGLAPELYEHNKMSELVHCNTKDEVHPKSLQANSTIAYRRLKKKREERPLMNEVNGECSKQSDVVEAHKLKDEFSSIFNIKYFEDTVLAGKWDETERYLNQFTNLEDDNRYSFQMFFEIRKQKYLEALDRNDRANAAEILVKELKIFSKYNAKVFKEATLLISLDNIRESDQLSRYEYTKSQRHIVLGVLKRLLDSNPSINFVS